MRAKHRRLELGLVTATLLLAERAVALPAPMSDQELLDASDLVIDGVGAEVECQGPPVTSGNVTYTHYVTRVFPSQTLKGEAMRTVEVAGYHMDFLEPIAGGWSPDPVPVGWSGRLHLVQNDDSTYSEVWWNGFDEDSASAPEPLPDCGAGGAGGMGGQGGGASFGGANAGGDSGAGTGGAAGTSTAGTGGTAGASTGGVAGAGTGGTGGATNGGAAGAWVGGTGGALGGTGGAVTGGTGGKATGGTGGTGGEPSGGVAGELTGGAAGALIGSGGAGPSGGDGGDSSAAGGNGGEVAADGPGSSAPRETSGDDGGCGCRVPAGRSPSGGLALLLGAVACLARARRSRRASPTGR